MNALSKRLAALEQTKSSQMPRWHCLRRYENETDAEAVAAYEAEHGSIGTDNVIMRVVVSKPGMRPAVARIS